MRKVIDGKYHIDIGINGIPEIVKTGTGEIIPLGEPVIIFRARDIFALPALRFYQETCKYGGCTVYQQDMITEVIRQFESFKRLHPDVMKEPGITKGKPVPLPASTPSTKPESK